MAIRFSSILDGGILRVRAAGFDDSLEEVEAYSLAVIEACVQSGVSQVLCDERELEYRLGTLDTYAAAEFLSAHAPRVGRAAIVANPRHIADARFWEDVAVNRGLRVKVFREVDAAWDWLKEPEEPAAG